jgi:hypothetical protein
VRLPVSPLGPVGIAIVAIDALHCKTVAFSRAIAPFPWTGPSPDRALSLEQAFSPKTHARTATLLLEMVISCMRSRDFS